jgi:hypothetical protein
MLRSARTGQRARQRPGSCVQSPAPHSLGQAFHGYFVHSAQVGDGPGHAQGAGVGSRGKAQGGIGPFPKAALGFAQRAEGALGLAGKAAAGQDARSGVTGPLPNGPCAPCRAHGQRAISNGVQSVRFGEVHFRRAEIAKVQKGFLQQAVTGLLHPPGRQHPGAHIDEIHPAGLGLQVLIWARPTPRQQVPNQQRSEYPYQIAPRIGLPAQAGAALIPEIAARNGLSCSG